MKNFFGHFYFLLWAFFACSTQPAFATGIIDDINAGGFDPKPLPISPEMPRPAPTRKPTTPTSPATMIRPPLPAPAPAPPVTPMAPVTPTPPAPLPPAPTPTPPPAPPSPPKPPKPVAEIREEIKNTTHYSPGSKCAEQYAPLAQPVVQDAINYLDPNIDYSAWRKFFIHDPRDRIRKFIQVNLQGRAYPVVANDDGTAIKAWLLARSTLGDLKDKQSAIFASLTEKQKAKLAKMFPNETITDVERLSFADYMNELKQLIDEVEAYPAAYKNYLNETASMDAQIRSLQERIQWAKDSNQSHNISLDMPQATVNADNSISMTTKIKTFSTLEEMMLKLDDLQRELINRRGAFRTTIDYKNKSFPYLLIGYQDSLAIDQAIRIKKLETYLKEFQKYTKDQDFVGDVPEDISKIIGRVESIFTDPKQDSLKPEYRLPKWIWNRLRWMQFNAEAKAFFLKDVVEVQDGAQSIADALRDMKLVEIVQNSSGAEKRAIGLTTLAKETERTDPVGLVYSFISRFKPVQTLIGGSLITAGGSALGYAGGSLYEQLTWKNVRKEECAESSDDTSFSECLSAYLLDAFPLKGALTDHTGKNHLLDKDGNYLPNVQKEVDDAIRRRDLYMRAEFAKTDNAATSLNALKKRLKMNNALSSDEYRRTIVQGDETIFKVGLLGSGPKTSATKVNSLLSYKWKESFDKSKDTITVILNEYEKNPIEYDTNSDSNKKLKSLNLTYPGLCSDLIALLEDRAKFLRDKKEDEEKDALGSGGAPPIPSIE